MKDMVFEFCIICKSFAYVFLTNDVLSLWWISLCTISWCAQHWINKGAGFLPSIGWSSKLLYVMEAVIARVYPLTQDVISETLSGRALRFSTFIKPGMVLLFLSALFVTLAKKKRTRNFARNKTITFPHFSQHLAVPILIQKKEKWQNRNHDWLLLLRYQFHYIHWSASLHFTVVMYHNITHNYHNSISYRNDKYNLHKTSFLCH